ncbi:MAG: electron-transferring-flavoprotein dehydrogenase [Acidobacteriota bacterium]|jgi:electron-transferring-flavoprotein dehydrogenase|nr:electron-transferring-flavoprotein dehydrogenase [Acidobacteriota bacterium]
MAELPGIERETLDVDVVIVGAGPAGLAAAYQLATLVKAHNDSPANEKKLEGLSIALLEKGKEIGSHGISGAVMDPRGISELMPDWLERGCPVESPVTSDAFWYMFEKMKIAAPIMPPPLQNHGNYVISLGELVRWLAPIVGEMGVDLFAEFAASRVLVEEGRVVGVRTGDKGIDKNGQPKANFEPGVDVRAKVVILAEGPRGTLTKQLAEAFDLYAGKNPQVYSVGIKELWQLPDDRFAPGTVIHTMGWPLDTDTFGGGFIYGMKDRIVDIGLVIGLDYRNPTLDPHHEFQRYKLHPSIRALLEGGKMISAGAKAIPEGGYFSMPRSYGDGFLITGDSAGYLNGARLKGIHLGIKSGMLAAEAAYQALVAEDYSSAQLQTYESLFEASWAREELWSQRNFHQAFEYGQLAGMLNAGVGIVTGGRGFGFINRLEGHAGHERMERIQRYFGSEDPHPPEKMKFDNTYTFDKVSDVYYGGVVHEENQPAHLLIADTEVCITRCTEEFGNPCLHFCPANVYEPQLTADGRGKVPFLNFTNCFHCKTCDIMDPYQVITWVPPEGGGGPDYKKL